MSSQMVEIAHEPLKRIVVRELVKYDNPQQLVSALSFIMKMGQPVLLTWAENMVFVSQPIPPSDMPEEYARGELYIASDRKSTRLNSSHDQISYAVFCLKKKNMLIRILD